MLVAALIALVSVGSILYWYDEFQRKPRLLDRWAEDQGVRIVERRWIARTSGGYWIHGFSQGGSIYRLVLRDRGGRMRKAMACIAGPLYPRPTPIEVRWGAFDEPAWDDFAGCRHRPVVP